jgi:hypothetical protein
MTFLGILIFSTIETATVAIWGTILGVGAGLPLGTRVLAIGVLEVGYIVEHIIAHNNTKGRPLLSFPRP